MKGRPVSEGTRQKIRQSNTGKPGHIKTIEERLNISNKLKGRPKTKEQRLAQSLAMTGRTLTSEHKDSICQTMRKVAKDPAYIDAVRQGVIKAQLVPGYWDKVSAGLNRHYSIPGNREKRARIQTPEEREKNGLAQKERYKKWSSEERQQFIETCSASARASWANGRDKSYLLGNLIICRPNKIEIRLQSILDSAFPETWKYVGNFQLLIGRKCPDFWNGDHMLIELFGDYWHEGENPQERIDHFARYGYKCLVIWEKELKDSEEILRRVGTWQ